MTEEIVTAPQSFSSLTIGKLIEALSKAQGEFEHAKKDVKNEFFKSKYADLASVIDAARAPLSKNGLAVVQLTRIEEGRVILITTLAHSSGEWMKSEYPINPVKNDPQGFGSAMTYARRYCFSAITGIAQEDDDGNSASGKSDKQETAASRNKRYKAIKDDLMDSHDLTSLQHNWLANQGAIKEFQAIDEQFYMDLVNAKESRKKELAA